MSKKRAKGQAGFTLVEMLVVVALIGIVAAIAVGQYGRAIDRAREATLRENLFVMRTQINNYFADKGRYPYDLHALVDDKYLRAVPQDPVTQSADTWDVIMNEVSDQDISTEPGIVDVRSGASGVSLDGTLFSDW
ncbi:MAG: type II secretion system GspH family protein [Acidobacteriota bacterium]|nr:type II secretion system GspH family protein [Acidobacteriota bacterium]